MADRQSDKARKAAGVMRGTNSTVFQRLGIVPVINCCGVYTDLGGSVLSPEIWSALTDLNRSYVRMRDLLDITGVEIAELVGAEAARVTPGASAAITLAVAATMTGNIGQLWEQLPDTTGLKSRVIISAHHLRAYKYGVCVRASGARLCPVGDEDRYDPEAILRAIDAETACVFVPAHLLDGFEGADQLAELVGLVRRFDVPVIVDAAYLVYPTQLLSAFHEAGADLVCISAKYFSGPNSGGFVAGRRKLIDAVSGLDFTRFESGRFRGFGRAFKMSRYDVAATALALEQWLEMDHDARWAGYARKVDAIASYVARDPRLEASPRCFTMSEELVEGPLVNCLALTFQPDSGLSSLAVAGRLRDGDPSIETVCEEQHLIIAVDALLDGQEHVVGTRLAQALDRT